MIIVCKNKSDNSLGDFFSNTFYCTILADNLASLYENIRFNRVDAVLLDEAFALESDPKDLLKFIKDIKEYGFSHNLYIPIIVTLRNDTNFCEDKFFDIPIDDFVRTDFTDNNLLTSLKHFSAVKKLFNDMALYCKDFMESPNNKLNYVYMKSMNEISKINILAINASKDITNRLEDMDFGNLYCLDENELSKFDINKNEIDCLVMEHNNRPSECMKKYFDSIKSSNLPVFMIHYPQKSCSQVRSNKNEYGNFFFDHTNLEIKRRIVTLSVLKKLWNLHDYFFKNLKLTLKDQLTGVYNRRFIDNYSTGATGIKHSGSVCLIDINKFKQVNDLYGHAAGDKILKSVSETIVDSVRNGTDSVCRYGGDEFLLIMPNTTLKEAKSVAERVSNNISSKNFNINGKEIDLSVSFGISSFISGDIYSATEKADDELFKQKSKSKAVRT